MQRKMVGLNTYLYTFSLKDAFKYAKAITRLSKTGKVTEVFVNNKLAFEYKKNRKA